MNIWRRESGFTLLELLIGLALLGLILALMFGGLRLGIKSWDAGSVASDEGARIRVFEGFIRRQLNEVYPYFWKPADSQTLAFLGAPDVIHYVGFLPGGGGRRNGFYLLSLAVERKDRIQRLVLKSLPLSPETRDFSGMQGAEKTVLASGSIAEGVEELVFGYFGAETEQSEPKWLTRWDDTKRLPQLVRLQVKLATGQEWPELVVALRVTGDERE
ncbi:MAG: prepilin-type N-terminal cleavage/methylation domain-containing protein [Gammaproteobacteria bacterium]|nr:prepilin-type N-terminal cleavage/methylation domain-containing protein [Gammaproteobacteria bacterium]MBU1732913.1 prepilin-type N-terminal cleavage/methylation domain-containing protein [Gammaproteobacteria bacterium]MBU1891961.1 prepilin-type N-terminal cleavage/methylation domain-containing protein [Gammaproteobacteria bacterium]